MARQPRLAAPGYPHHVIQRGNNRQQIFLDDDDRRRFLDALRTQAREHQVAVHAYVLMDNHIHLLVTPNSVDGLPRMMQALGRGYVRHFNQRHGRTGTLWEGRYRSTVIEAERYLLACMTYIELNPVRAGMVGAPADFAWSSHGHHVGLRADPLVSPHALYWAMGDTPFARERAYGELISSRGHDADQKALSRAAHSGWALGSEEFLAGLGTQLNRRVEKAKPGRPPKPSAKIEENCALARVESARTAMNIDMSPI